MTLPIDIYSILHLYLNNEPNYLLYVYINNIIQYNKIKINWYKLSTDTPLTVDFIDCFFYKIKWSVISRYYILEDDVLYRYYDKLNWKYICMYQKLSNTFILDNLDLIKFDSLLLNKNYSNGYIKYIMNTKIGQDKLIKILGSKKRYKNILYKYLN